MRSQVGKLREIRKEQAAYESVRTPHRNGLVHRDRRGLEHLMSDYLALGDELEAVEQRRDTIAAPPPDHVDDRRTRAA
jgi:hypothetical protein